MCCSMAPSLRIWGQRSSSAICTFRRRTPSSPKGTSARFLLGFRVISGKRRINVDVPLIVAALLLTGYGLAMVFSAGHTDVRTAATGAWKAQLVWTLVGIIGAYGVSRASVRLIEWMT